MQFLNFLAAALVSLAASLIPSSLSAQTEEGYYATVEMENQDTVLYIKHYQTKPSTSESVLYVFDQELSDINLDIDSSLVHLDLREKIKLAKLTVDNNFKPKSTGRWFNGLINMKKIEGLEKLNTDSTTAMNQMFYKCSSLEEIDLSSFNTENVKDMRYMFEACRVLTSLNLSSFDTKNVTDMGSMFRDCYALENIDLSSFNTENVKDMQYMFGQCVALKSIKGLNTFNTQNVSKMLAMFWNCKVLEGVDISNFKTDSLTNIQAMFRDSPDLESVYIRNYNGEKITDAKNFGTAKLFVGPGSKVGNVLKDTIIVVKEEGATKIGFLPTKTKYYIGEALDLTGGYISINVKYDNAENEEESLDIKLFPLEALANTVKGFDNTQAGTHTVSVEYGGVEYSFEVEIESGELKEVSVVSEPSLKEYTMPVAVEDLNLSGGVIKKVYENTEMEGEDVEVSLKMENCKFEVDLSDIKEGENTIVLKFDLGDTTFEWEYSVSINKPSSTEDLLGASSCVAAFEAWSTGGVLYVSATRGGVLEVFSPRGVLVRCVSIEAGSSVCLPLERGVYVLRLGGEVKKVVVE